MTSTTAPATQLEWQEMANNDRYVIRDMAIDSLKIRIYFNTVSALLNACVIN